MVSSRPEPEWDDESRDLIVALALVQRNTGRHGEWLPDATAPGGSPSVPESGYRYVHTGPHTNWAEKAIRDAEAQYRKDAGKDANLNGMFWGVELLEYPVPPTT